MRVAFTRRSVKAELEPLRHAATGHRTGRSRRSSFAALCGAAIGRWADEDFDPAHPRACQRCSKQISTQRWG